MPGSRTGRPGRAPSPEMANRPIIPFAGRVCAESAPAVKNAAYRLMAILLEAVVQGSHGYAEKLKLLPGLLPPFPFGRQPYGPAPASIGGGPEFFPVFSSFSFRSRPVPSLHSSQKFFRRC